MVYEVKCENCGELIDFGGHDPEEKAVGSHSRIPEDAIKFFLAGFFVYGI